MNRKFRLVKRGNFKFSVSRDSGKIVARFIGTLDKSISSWYKSRKNSLVGYAQCNPDDEFSYGQGTQLAVGRCMRKVIDVCNNKLLRLSRRLSTEESIAITKNNKRSVAKRKHDNKTVV